MKTKRRKAYEKARNIKNNNLSKVGGQLNGFRVRTGMVNRFLSAGEEQQSRDNAFARGSEKARRIKNKVTEEANKS